jgi:Flp pilus assembly protein TadG
MALVLPLLVALVFGIIAFGFGFARWVALTNGAREGARYLAIHSTDSGATAEAESRAVRWAGLACNDGGCTFAASDCSAPNAEDASFAITMDRFSPFSLPGISLDFPMTAEAVMQCGG